MARISDGAGLMVIAGLHELVGLVEGFDVSVAIARDGVLDALGQDWLRHALFWFHVTGLALFVIGDALRVIEKASGAVPARFGAMMLGVGVFGAVLLPVSGFWLVIAWGAFMLVRAMRRRPTPAR